MTPDELTQIEAALDANDALIAQVALQIARDGMVGRDREIERLREQLRAESLESRVAEWVKTRIGEDHMHPAERAMRLLEEAAELAQAEGVSGSQAAAQVAYVFSRPAGNPIQEAGGVAVCLLGYCASRDTTFLDVAFRELQRIESKPVSEIRGSVARKSDADLITCVPGQDCCTSHRNFNICELRHGHEGPHKSGGLTWDRPL